MIAEVIWSYVACSIIGKEEWSEKKEVGGGREFVKDKKIVR